MIIIPSGNAVDVVQRFFWMPCKWQFSTKFGSSGHLFAACVVSVPSISAVISSYSLLYCHSETSSGIHASDQDRTTKNIIGFGTLSVLQWLTTLFYAVLLCLVCTLDTTDSVEHVKVSQLPSSARIIPFSTTFEQLLLTYSSLQESADFIG